MNWESKLLELLAASLVRPVILAAAAALLLRAFRIDHPASKHVVWTMVLAAMLLIPFASVMAPRVEVAALPRGVLPTMPSIPLTRIVATSDAGRRDTLHDASVTPQLPQKKLGASSEESASSVSIDHTAAPSPTPAKLAPAHEAPTAVGASSLSVGSIVVWCYIAGLIVAAVYRIAGAIILSRLIAQSRRMATTPLRDSDDVTVPLTVGIVRPLILLPSNWRNWNRASRRSILAHEIAHIRRHDLWVLALCRTVKCVFWFHPMAWWLTRKVSELAEMACDAAALRTIKDPSSYARILLDFSTRVNRRGYRAALPGLAMVGRSPLSRRIEQILAAPASGRRLKRPALVLSIVGVPAVCAAATLEFTAIARPLMTAKKIVAGKIEEALPRALPQEPISIPLAALWGQQPALRAPQPPTMAPREFIDRYCIQCHTERARAGGFVLENRNLAQIRNDAEVWEKVARRMTSILEPSPQASEKPDRAVRLAFAAWLEGELDRNAPPYTPAPGPHRLNRTEYANAIRDIFSIEISPALLLPSDDYIAGFDNIVEALNNIRAEEYKDAAHDAADRVTTLVMSSPGRRQVFTCHPIWNDPDAVAQGPECVRKIIGNLVARAYRRPPTPEDMAALLAVYESNNKGNVYLPDKSYFDEWGFEKGIEKVVRTILSDRSFLYRTEMEPANGTSGQAYRLSGLELASRLSFFLWSTGPDSQLMDLAVRGQLQDPAILERETLRMLRDPRAEALTSNFGAQWLRLRSLDRVDPLPSYLDFDEPLRQAMRREMELFFSSVVQEDRSVVDLLDANYTFVNERLARHYGIQNVNGAEFRRITLGPEFDVRRGVLGKASFLSVTSHRDRTSLTTRGVAVLEALQGTWAPPPPPNIPPMPRQTNKTLRKMMEESLSMNPSCVSCCVYCHKLFDPLGIALENFDLAGRWRTTDVGQPIDPITELVDGTKLTGPADVRNVLVANSDQFVRTMAEKMLTYALGRRVSYQDMPLVRSIARDAAKENNRFSAIVLGIVKSAPFQTNTKS